MTVTISGHMLQTYRVTSAFSAKQLRRAPLRLEHFEIGELLVVLSSEEGRTSFCRQDLSQDLEGRRHFVISDQEFERSTEALPK